MDDSLRLKNINRRTILNYIYRHPCSTKKELSEVTGLTFMTAKNVIDDLLKKGLVSAASDEGKPRRDKSVKWQINSKYGYTVGVHVNIYQTIAAVMDLNGSILNLCVLPSNPDLNNPVTFVNQIYNIIKRILIDVDSAFGKFIGIGISLPGPIDSEQGMILTPPNIQGIHYLKLADYIKKEFQVPVILEKDTNAIAWGEFRYNAENIPENSTMIYIDADAGIGSGIILDGRLYRGNRFKAGEFGHMLCDITGPVCNCGRKGCLEVIASGIAVCRDYSAHLLSDIPSPHAPSLSDIFERAAENDILAVSLLNTSAKHMGESIASLQQMIDADYIVLGGALTRQYGPYFDIVRSSLPGIRLIHASADNSAAVRGLGDLLVNKYLSESDAILQD